MLDHPIFMSQQHVDMLNQRLSTSSSVTALCYRLSRDLTLLHELSDGPNGSTVYWRVDLARSGSVSFALDPGIRSHDVLVCGDYWAVIDAVRGRGEMPLPQGSSQDIESMMALLTSPEIGACAIQVRYPDRAPE